MKHGVAHEIFDGAMEQFTIARYPWFADQGKVDRAAPFVSLNARVFGNVGNDFTQIDGDLHATSPSLRTTPRRPGIFRVCETPTAKPLFVTDKATRLTDCSARYNFARACQEIGLRTPQPYCKHGRGPRIHDLRHSFAVKTMIKWYRTGKDPAREMIRLTTYLGHRNPSNTYWYLEAVPELLDLAMARATADSGEAVQ